MTPHPRLARLTAAVAALLCLAAAPALANPPEGLSYDEPFATITNPATGETTTVSRRADGWGESHRRVLTRDRDGRITEDRRVYNHPFAVRRSPDGSGASRVHSGPLGRFLTRMRWDAEGRPTMMTQDDLWDEEPPENMLNRHLFRDNRRPSRLHLPFGHLRHPDGSTVTSRGTEEGGREVEARNPCGEVTRRDSHPPRRR
ncbi:MAG: hypothetical protein CL910_17810 [Deltaproteobacteria bacterium]|jgi:hypothetical protein|nr:hypothetical protein [Deltaproteobacteria bacterium]